jgi:hypothetical protein
VSYGLRLADKARRGLSALPSEVQETVLDYLDELTADARIRSRPRQLSRDEVFELTTRLEGKLYVVWMVARFDHRTGDVSIGSIGHAARD